MNYYEIDAISSSYLKHLLYTINPPENIVGGKAVELGSLIDILITSPEYFHESYIVCDTPVIERPQHQKFLSKIIELEEISTTTIRQLHDEIYKRKTVDSLHSVWETVGMYKDYIRAKRQSNKIVLSSEEMLRVVNCAHNIEHSKYTYKYFETITDEDPFVDFGLDIQYHLFQQAIYKDLYVEKYDYTVKAKALVDMLVFNVDTMTIQPIDIKTIDGHVYEFRRSAYNFRYDIQAAWYKKLVQKEYPHFHVNDMIFLVGSQKYDEPAMPFKFASLERAERDIVTGIYRYVHHTLSGDYEHPMELQEGGVLLC